MKFIARHRARKRAIQAIYSWQLSGNCITDIIEEFLSEQDMLDVDLPYFQKLLNGISTYVLELDKKIDFYISRKLRELDQVEKAVLRVAVFELYYCNDIPYRVTINEAIELVKIFGAHDNSYKFINGVLDKIISSMPNNPSF